MRQKLVRCNRLRDLRPGWDLRLRSNICRALPVTRQLVPTHERDRRPLPTIAVSSTKSVRRPQTFTGGSAPIVSAGPVSGKFLPLLVLLFVGSGAAALIYEIVWFQLLSLIIGSSAVSMGVLLGTFMGGMCQAA